MSRYIKSLPQSHEAEWLTTPMWFDEQDLVWLKGTYLELETKELKASRETDISVYGNMVEK